MKKWLKWLNHQEEVLAIQSHWRRIWPNYNQSSNNDPTTCWRWRHLVAKKLHEKNQHVSNKNPRVTSPSPQKTKKTHIEKKNRDGPIIRHLRSNNQGLLRSTRSTRSIVVYRSTSNGNRGSPATESWFTKDAARNIIYQSLKIQRLGPNLNQEFLILFTVVSKPGILRVLGHVPLSQRSGFLSWKQYPVMDEFGGCCGFKRAPPCFFSRIRLSTISFVAPYHYASNTLAHISTWQVQIGNAKWNEDQMTLQGHLRWRPHGINYGLLWCEVGTHSSHMVVVPNLRF